MSKTSGGVRTLYSDAGGTENATFAITQRESLEKISDPVLRREVKRAISKFDSRLGIGTKNIFLANIEGGALGVHSTAYGRSQFIALNSKYYKNESASNFVKKEIASVKSGFIVKTNKPIQSTVIHELAHSKWNTTFANKKHYDAEKEIKDLFVKYKKDRKSSFGRYSRQDVNEFYAEGITKGLIGNHDKYTKKLFAITKKYGL